MCLIVIVPCAYQHLLNLYVRSDVNTYIPVAVGCTETSDILLIVQKQMHRKIS